jgi:hypothetical protein
MCHTLYITIHCTYLYIYIIISYYIPLVYFRYDERERFSRLAAIEAAIDIQYD